MAAMATEKVQSTSLNLGFPAAYQSVYAAKQRPLAYFPSAYVAAAPYVGDGDINALRLARKAEADYMANAKVNSTVAARRRYTNTPHGNGVIPPPLLGQRVYANPSNGYSSVYSARQDSSNAPFSLIETGRNGGCCGDSGLSGGVLRTRQGQAYGKQQLLKRIGELNIISDKVDTIGGPPGRATSSAPIGMTQDVAENTKIELDLLLQQITDAFESTHLALERAFGDEDVDEGDEEEGEDEDVQTMDETVGTQGRRSVLTGLWTIVGELTRQGGALMYKLLRLLFVLVPVASERDLTAIKTKIDYAKTVLDAIGEGMAHANIDAAATRAPQIETNLKSVQAMFARIVSYVEQMSQTVNKSDVERGDISRALIKSLKFGKDLKSVATPFLTGLVPAGEQAAFAGGAKHTGRRRAGDHKVEGFSRSGKTREDSETAVMRGDRRGFAPDERDAFGYASGEWYPNNGREAAAYFGDASGVNSNGPGWEAIHENTSEKMTRMGKRFDKTTGGYNVHFG